ncbi:MULTISPECIES: HigA family addiction module antitoxin [unclassified Herbaspirillum]|nr:MULTISPECIES: HigA family addiction module antitoxin [unclassified Herbaspirillum]
MDSENYRTPGQLIETLLAERGWSNRLLATVLDVEESGVSKLISAKKAVTPELAISLEEVFEVPAEKFLTLQRNLDLAKARIIVRPNPTRALRAKIFADIPVVEMIKRGWINVEDVRDIEAIETSVSNFFGTGSFDQVNSLPHAAKKTDADMPASKAQIAWLYRVRQIATDMLMPAYSEERTKASLVKLKSFLSAPEEARHVPRLLAECGIRLVIVEGLKSSKIDGACLWLDERSPVIGMTLRFDRMDNFWFVLRHELEHVLQRHGMSEPMLDIEIGTEYSTTTEEKLANAAAADFCAPQAKIDSFIARKAPLFPERDFLGLAKILGVHPCLVAGQIQFKTGRYELFRGHLAKIRDHVLPSAIVDGWGDIAPVGVA